MKLLLNIVFSALFCLFFVPAKGQNRHHDGMAGFRLLDTSFSRMGLYFGAMPIDKQTAFSGGLDMQIAYAERLSAGVSFGFALRDIDNDFGYIVGKSQISYFDFNIYNECLAWSSYRFEAALVCYTGYAKFRLADKTIIEKVWVPTDYGGFWYDKPSPVADNHFFRIAPGLTLRYRVSHDISVEANGAYNMYWGKPKFGNQVNFNTYNLHLGIRVDLY